MKRNMTDLEKADLLRTKPVEDPANKMKRKLTDDEMAQLAKVKTGFVSMDKDGRLLIINDTNYFENCRKEKEAEAAAEAAHYAKLLEREAEAKQKELDGKEPTK